MSPLHATASSALPAPRRAQRPTEWLGMMPFLGLHVATLGALWSGVTREAVICCTVLYGVRMFGVTAGYHRYFSHRTFKTSRFVQFLLALLATSSLQKGALWWAAWHRHHHKFSDAPEDVHSPKQDGFWYAHMGWLFNHTGATDLSRVKDLARYPELRFLNRFWLLPPIALALAVTLMLGWPGFFCGFCLSTVLLWHGTFAINSLAHVFGKTRFKTRDTSRNNAILALLTLGEGWHNNHHHHQTCARQGFRWWEVDVTYYAIRALAALGLVWDVREPPAALLRGGRGGAVRASATTTPSQKAFSAP